MVPCGVCAFAVCALNCFAFALLCFVLLGALSARWFFPADLCFVSVALAFESLLDLALWDIPFCCVVSVFDVYSIRDAISRFLRGFGGDYY